MYCGWRTVATTGMAVQMAVQTRGAGHAATTVEKKTWAIAQPTVSSSESVPTDDDADRRWWVSETQPSRLAAAHTAPPTT